MNRSEDEKHIELCRAIREIIRDVHALDVELSEAHTDEKKKIARFQAVRFLNHVNHYLGWVLE